MGKKLLLCIQYKSPISRWAMPEGRGKGQYTPYDLDDVDDGYGNDLLQEIELNILLTL